MKKVKFLTDTAYQGPRKEGDIVDVPDDFADRWVKNGIAELVSGKVEKKAATAKTDADEKESEVDYSTMNAKELYALCKEHGLEVEAKKAKEYYIEKLTAKE